MEFNSPRQQEIDFYFDPIGESEIDDLVGSAVSDLQDLLYGTSVSAKQILKIMFKVLGEAADYLVLISEKSWCQLHSALISSFLLTMKH